MMSDKQKLLLLWMAEEQLLLEAATFVVSISVVEEERLRMRTIACRRHYRRQIRARCLTGPRMSALEVLLNSGDADAYQEYFRVDRDTFYRLLNVFAAEYRWRDVRTAERIRHARLRGRALDARACMALTLRYLASALGSNDQMLIAGLARSTRSRYLSFGVACLYAALRSFRDIRVRWTRKLAEASAALAPPSLTGMCAVIDGKQHELERSGNEYLQRVTYNGYKSINNLKGLYIFYLDGSIARARLAPGCWHDSRVYDTWIHSMRIVCNSTELRPALWVCGDSAFGSGRNTCVQTVSALPPSAGTQARRLFNASRTTSEYGIYDLTRGWRILSLPLPSDDPHHRELVWRCCLMLHNARVRWMGHGHILHAFQQ